MRMDVQAAHRHWTGTFNNQRYDAPRTTLAAPLKTLKVDNLAGCLTVAVLFGSLVMPAESVQASTHAETSTQALLPVATPASGPAPGADRTFAQLGPSLLAVANRFGRSAAGTCMAHPRICGTVAGASIAASLIGTAVLGASPSPPGPTTAPLLLPPSGAPAPRSPHPPVPTLPAAAAAEMDDLQREIAGTTLPDGTPLSQALAKAAGECEGSRQCLADRINAILAQLPRLTVAHLQAMVAHARMPASPTAAAGWPPLADAYPVPPQWEALIEILASIYTPEVAALQADLERIVAHPSSMAGGPVADWNHVNAHRTDTIQALLQEAGCQVERQSFPVGTELAALLDRQHGVNLLARFPAGSPADDGRRLLLVAHGDMIGLSRGSQGAYDNGAGVATLLHVARQLQADIAGLDCHVELLVTGDEEMGLVGSRGYAAQCRAHGACPTFAVNIDLVGRGGLGYALSDTAALASQPRLRGAAAGTPLQPSPAETSASALLQAVFADHGFQRWAQAPSVITSDHLSFQNVSIPAVGLSQVSQEQARQWRRIDDAQARWLDAYVAAGRGSDSTPGLADAAEQQAFEDYYALRQAHPLAPPSMVHSAGDRLYRIDPRMAVQFGDALAAFVRRWATMPDPSPVPGRSEADATDAPLET